MELKQATSDKTSDKSKRLIDANALVEKFLSLTLTVTGLRNGKGVILELLNKYRNGILQLINEQPTVDAAPVVHGHWKPHMEEMEDFFGKPHLCMTGYYCSACGFYTCHGGNFCAECGAKMDGGASA